jgi:hypothetical protein
MLHICAQDDWAQQQCCGQLNLSLVGFCFGLRERRRCTATDERESRC